MNETSLKFPIQDSGQYDVLIVGGGLSGCCAAIASARHGAKTLLAESMPYIGGNGITGLPLSSFRATDSNQTIVGGIPLELVNRLKKRGAITVDIEENNWIFVDCEILQIELTHMLDEAGAEILTHSPLISLDRNDTQINAAIFYSKDYFLRYQASVFVDASGDAQLARVAGLETPMGRQRDGKTQSMTLMFTLGGIDEERMIPWAEATAHWEELRPKFQWRNPRSGPALSGGFPIPGKKGVWSFNVTRMFVDKGTDSRMLTQAEKEGRYQIEEFVEAFLRPHISGFENCYLTQIACRVGVRETRRIVGLYELQKEDLTSLRKFPDSIACNSYPVDIHSPDGGSTQWESKAFPKGGYYTIPYRSLVANGIGNLLASGRCLSASHEALSAVRVLSAAMATGEAAGTAAAMCATQKIYPANLDSEELRTLLKGRHAIVD